MTNGAVTRDGRYVGGLRLAYLTILSASIRYVLGRF